MPEAYDDAFAGLTPQAAGPLLDAAGVRAGIRVLDIAAGPGYVTAAASERGAEAVGIDFSAAMIARARSRRPGLDLRVGDAEALPVEDASFDAVVMNFGLLHLARPERALAEAFRVLRPGGRCAFTVWAPPEAAVGFGIVLRAVEAHGRSDVPIPPGPPFFRFSDPAECRVALAAAGFREIEVGRVPQTWRLEDPDALFLAMQAGTVRTAGLLRAQEPEAREAIRTAIRAEVVAHSANGAYELAMPAVLASGRKERPNAAG